MVFVLTILITLIFWSVTLALKEHCDRVDTKTVKCNYIPTDIPAGISSVRILDFIKQDKTFEVNSSYFETDNWKLVKSLELTYSVDDSSIVVMIKSKCFHELKRLQELHIHLMTRVRIDPNTFIGLDTLKVLDMSRCVRLGLNELVPCLKGNNKLPSLESLKLLGLNLYKEPQIIIDIKFAQALEGKNVTSLDFSHTKISHIYTSAVFSTATIDLKYVNLSYSVISDVSLHKKDCLNKFDHLHMLDISYARVFWDIPFIKIFNMTWSSSDIPDRWHCILAPKTVNLSSCIPESSSIWVFNSSLNVNRPLQLNSQEVIIRQNNFKHLDIKMQCSIYTAFSIKHIDLAQNGLDFLHPSIPVCFPNLYKLDLSGNQLYKMVADHRLLFEQLLVSLPRIRTINLSDNFLTSIPEDLFIQNHDLEMIDLSRNKLDQVTFKLWNLEKLDVLDLQYNSIKILNGISLNNLESINSMEGKPGYVKTTIYLENNPISCSQCEAKNFLNWLTNTKSVNISDLYCVTQNGSTQKLIPHALELVQGICNKKIILISASTSVGLSALITMVTMTLIYKYKKRKRNKTNRMKLLNKLQEGQGQYEFVAFLSYSCDDKDFAENYLMDKFNENLQLMIGIDRNLVCAGDLNFRPGSLIVDETARCIETSSVFVIVVSDSYCTSTYCHYEVDMAYRLNRPIILMMKGHVDENLMTPTMKILFKNNVRVIWTHENDEYILKTTWENVCTSVLDLIVQNEKRM